MFSRQAPGDGQPSNADQPPRPKEPQNGAIPISAPADPIAQMKTIVAVETERCLNHMKELLAKEGQTINGNNKAANQNSRPRMVTTTIHVVDGAKVHGISQGKCSATTAKAMDTWLRSARTPRCLGEGDNRPPHHLCMD